MNGAVPGVSTIDLSKLRFADPASIVGMCVFATGAVKGGDHVEFTRPVSDDAANYLSRIRLPTVLDALNIQHHLPIVRERHIGNALVELSSFDSTSGAEKLAHHLFNAIEKTDEAAARMLFRSVSVAGENVAHHSGQDKGFLMAQTTFGGSMMKFAVGDAGVGIYRTLRQSGASDDEQSLRLALQAGVSRFDVPGRGNGLRELADQVQSLKGSLTLMSGRAVWSENRAPRTSASVLPRLRGSVIAGTFPISA